MIRSFVSLWRDLTARHAVEINLTTASQCAASLLLLSDSLPVAAGGGVTLTDSGQQLREEGSQTLWCILLESRHQSLYMPEF